MSKNSFSEEGGAEAPKVSKWATAVIDPLTKLSNETTAQLVLTPTFDNFSINGLASKLMKVEHGNHVSIIRDPEATDINEKYALAVVKDADIDKIRVAKVAAVNAVPGFGKTLNFRFSGIYGAMVLGDVTKDGVSKAALVEAGLVKKTLTPSDKDAYTLVNKLTFDLGEEITFTNAKGIELRVYPLVNRTVVGE